MELQHVAGSVRFRRLSPNSKTERRGSFHLLAAIPGTWPGWAPPLRKRGYVAGLVCRQRPTPAGGPGVGGSDTLASGILEALKKVCRADRLVEEMERAAAAK